MAMNRIDWTDGALVAGVLLIGAWVAADFGWPALLGFLGGLLVVMAGAAAFRKGRGGV